MDNNIYGPGEDNYGRNPAPWKKNDMKPENNYFKRIEIKGDVNNLPTGTEPYLSHSISGHVGYRRCVPSAKQRSNQFENISSEWWLKNIDWYLLPVSTPETIVGPTEEEIKNWAYDESEQNICGDYERGMARGKEVGAYWYRSQLKTVNFKDVLKKFLLEVDPEGKLGIARKLVDDYLSGKGKESK